MSKPWIQWSEETRAEAIRQWELGKSATEIAEALGGYTRNAVIGLIHRARAKGEIVRADPKPEKRVSREKVQKARPGTHQRPTAALVASASGYSPVPVPPTPERTVPYDPTTARLWTSRRFGECAYPVSGDGADTLSCCSPTKGKTYCAHHRAIMYRPQTEKPERRLERLARLAA